MSKIKEITVSSKRSCQIQGEFFTFEASELISLETDDNIDEVRQKAWSRVNDEVDIRLQLIMWSMIDKLKDEGNVELDYLQVFKIRKEGNKVVINQSQEVPEYSCTYEIEIEDVQIDDKIKVYVIDSGEYSTMLFPSEY